MGKVCILVAILLNSLFNSARAQITPKEAVPLMQKGVNLGNTMEPPLEGEWGNPPVQQYYFDMYKAAGFKCVRIPITWDMHTQDTVPYHVDETWMQRVEQVVDWGLARGLFIVINAHHEQWLKGDYTNAAYQARFDSIWAQVSRRFKDRSDHLFFEILNEPYGLTKAQNDELQQRELGIIRETNSTRIVIYQGNNWGGSDDLINAAIPNDQYLIGSFHSYDPYTFGQLGQGTWGTPADVAALTSKFAAVKNWSVAHNIPVFLGEFGAVKTCDYNSRMKDYRTYVELSLKNNFVYCAWDDGGDYRIMEREAHGWNELKDILVSTTPAAPGNPVASLLQDTIIRLAWPNNRSDYDSIFIQRKAEAGNFLKVATLPGDSTHYTDWHLPQNHMYYYRVIAHYNADSELYSQPVQLFLPVFVVKTRQPYFGTAASIPGTIEAENFDYGGEGLAYHDSDPSNIGTAYRPGEGVDIYSMNGKGYLVGNVAPGEWMEYTVDVAQDGQYKVDTYVSAVQAGGTFSIKIGDAESGTLMVPNTNSWLTLKPVSVNLNLKAGEQVMRFTILGEPIFDIEKYDVNVITSLREVAQAGEPRIYVDAEKNIVIGYPAGFDPGPLRIYSTDGRLVRSVDKPAATEVLSLTGLCPGMYIVQVTGLGTNLSRKIILP